MLKLRTLYPYGLNDKIEDKDEWKLGKEYEDLIEKAFPSLPSRIQRDRNARHKNTKGLIRLLKGQIRYIYWRNPNSDMSIYNFC